MQKKYFLAATLLVSSAVLAQVRHNRPWHIGGFSVKTEVLSLASSLLDKTVKGGSLSGEVYFNDEFSLGADLDLESEREPGWKRMTSRAGGQFRWYLMQDDCNCSALFAGTYFSFGKVRQTVDHTYPNISSVSYVSSSLEAGLTGGLQALIARHFVLDPAIQLGMKFPHKIFNTETRSSIPDTKDKGILLRILLSVGYRF